MEIYPERLRRDNGRSCCCYSCSGVFLDVNGENVWLHESEEILYPHFCFAVLSSRYVSLSLSLIRVLLLSEMFFSYCFFYFFYLSHKGKKKGLNYTVFKTRPWREKDMAGGN